MMGIQISSEAKDGQFLIVGSRMPKGDVQISIDDHDAGPAATVYLDEQKALLLAAKLIHSVMAIRSLKITDPSEDRAYRMGKLLFFEGWGSLKTMISDGKREI
jgi:hypothetical protein